MNECVSFSPVQIEPEIFYAELQFWQIDSKLRDTFIEEDMVNSSSRINSPNLSQIPLIDIRELPSGKWRCFIWRMLTYPKSFPSPYGDLFIGMSMIVTIVSCLPFMSE